MFRRNRRGVSAGPQQLQQNAQPPPPPAPPPPSPPFVLQVATRSPKISPGSPSPSSAYPDCFLCKISHSLLRDPVVANDGITYERSQIEAWIKSKGWAAPSPYNSELLVTIRELKPNVNLKQAVYEYTELRAMQTTLKREVEDARREAEEARAHVEHLQRLLKESFDREFASSLETKLCPGRVANADNVTKCASDAVSITDHVADNTTASTTDSVTETPTLPQSPTHEDHANAPQLTRSVLDSPVTKVGSQSALASARAYGSYGVRSPFLVSVSMVVVSSLLLSAVLMPPTIALPPTINHISNDNQPQPLFFERMIPLRFQSGVESDRQAALRQKQLLEAERPAQRKWYQPGHWRARDGADRPRKNAHTSNAGHVGSVSRSGNGSESGSGRGGGSGSETIFRNPIEMAFIIKQWCMLMLGCCQVLLFGCFQATIIALTTYRFELILAGATLTTIGGLTEHRKVTQLAAKKEAFKAKSLERKDRNALRREEARQRSEVAWSP